MTTQTPDLDSITLLKGGHHRRTEGVCAMEFVAWMANEKHSDQPACTSPVIAAFVRSWNDSLADAPRNRLLKPLLPKLIGTRTTDADEETRAWMATDWLVRVQTPAWLDLAGLTGNAAELRALPPLTSAEIAIACQSVIENARGEASRAWAAAWAAGRAAARDAAWAAAWAAALAAARDAAWDAAWAAALAAGRDAARDAAWAAAWAAALAAAWDAAWDAADRWLAPTVSFLQSSAVELIEAMCAVGREQSAA